MRKKLAKDNTEWINAAKVELLYPTHSQSAHPCVESPSTNFKTSLETPTLF